jgi:hypothetical protein
MADSEVKSSRTQSTVQFPYRDLEAAIATARAIHDSGAVNGVAPDQLAALLGISGGTGNFMTRVATVRMFGLVGLTVPYQLTELGYAILDKDDQTRRAAYVRAFLNVPLYRKMHEAFRGRVLPSRPAGLERAMVDLGVAPKQATNARLAFDRSAKLAGFFSAGEDRLVEPVLGRATESRPEPAAPVQAPPIVSAVPPINGPSVHPFVQGLLMSLPQPGTPWPLSERVDWLRAAVHSFNLIYKSDGEITVLGALKARPTTAPTAPNGDRPTARGKAELDDDIPF